MKLIKKNGYNVCFGIIVIILGVMPLLLQADMIKSTTVLYLAKCMCFAMVAIGLDLIWGYTGILSLGHGLYFALGAYGMGMYLKLQATGGKITDFMQVGGLTELPAVWKMFRYLPNTLIFMLLIPGALAGILGYFIFKSRVKGVYFSIISQALTWAAYSLFIALSPYTNGNVGITEIKSLFGSIKGPKNQGNLITLFYVTLVMLILIYALSRFLVTRKFGKLLIAIRDGENRTYFSGYCVSRYKNVVYVLSAVYAALAGALFVNLNGSRLTRQGFWKIIKAYTAEAGITKEITPHTLRHSFAMHLLQGGASVKDIQTMMGHADISSTQVYVHLLDLDNHVKSVYNECHPRAKTS